LWEDQLRLHNLVHFPQLKSTGTTFPERVQEYSWIFFQLREELDELFQGFKIMALEFMVLNAPLK
jgi:hypothetical protein